jgi:hypothetical protein
METAMEFNPAKAMQLEERARDLTLRLIREGHVHDSHFTPVFRAVLDALEGKDLGEHK